MITMIAGVGFIGGILGPATVNCKSNTENYTQGDASFCVFQAMVFLYGTNSCIGWWSVQAFDIFLKVVRKVPLNREQNKKKDLIFDVYGWMWPALSVVIALAFEGLGSQGDKAWCFIRDADP